MDAMVAMAVAAIALSAPVVAQADVQFSASVSRERVSFAKPETFAYRLTMTTGANAENFSVMPVPAAMGDEGSAISRAGDPYLEGPGSATVTVRVTGQNGCSPTRNRPHGYEPDMRGLDVALPANTTAILVAPYKTGRWAPWVDSKLDLTFRIRRPNFPADPPYEIPPDQDIRAPAVSPTGQLGVHITMTTTPRTSWGGRLPVTTLKRSTEVRVRGRTAPPVRRQWITLRYYGPENKRTYKTLARVRTDRNGHFRLNGWKPRRIGAYELWAFYTSRRKSIASDYACPQTFEVRK